MKADIEQHALEEFPKECVGYVYKGAYQKLVNIASKPECRYQLSLKDKLMLFNICDELTALVHSHPVMDNEPSEGDLGAQEATGFTFWIIGTDGTNTTDIKEINL